MLAICSDLDETPNKDIYFETARYLNTTEETALGKGVGLEVGNTIYFDMPEHNFSYTNTDDDGRHKIHQLIDSGHIDCLHSFGDFVNTRASIEKYWSLIQSGKRKIEVWVDHAQAPTNLDNDIMQGQGAEVGKPTYHSDLTVKSGTLAFIWKGRVTSCVAQNVPRSYRSIFNHQHVKASIKTIALEFTKGWLARLGNKKYAMHQHNKVLRKTQLLDGTSVNEFMRCNPAWGGVSCFDQARGIHHVLTKKVLDTLVDNAGCSILYSHLGKVHSVAEPFTQNTRQAFELLAEYQKDNKILTTTTRRLLGYLRTVEELNFTVKKVDDETHIYVTTECSGEDLQGLTWDVERPERIKLYINQELYNDVSINHDISGKASISIQWHSLVFPFTKTNY
jgi:S-adenosylmethionine:tRNA-ribosyltransferase-isomerase (queuine synthetase)